MVSKMIYISICQQPRHTSKQHSQDNRHARVQEGGGGGGGGWGETNVPRWDGTTEGGKEGGKEGRREGEKAMKEREGSSRQVATWVNHHKIY